MRECRSIEEVRKSIDYLDNQIVKLISDRSRYVEQAAKFKKDTEDVKAPKRVEAVIQKVRTIADENNLNPDIIEQVYRTMISSFIHQELVHHSKINTKQG